MANFFFFFQYKFFKRVPALAMLLTSNKDVLKELQKKRIFVIQANNMSYNVHTNNILVPSNNYSIFVNLFYVFFFAKQYFFFKKKKIFNIFKRFLNIRVQIPVAYKRISKTQNNFSRYTHTDRTATFVPHKAKYLNTRIKNLGIARTKIK